MPLGGETVGRAYVKILADGSGMPQSIRREMEKAEPEFVAAGQRDSEAYREGFTEQWRKRDAKKVREALNEGIGKGEAFEEFFSGDDWDKFVKRLQRQFGDAGVVAAKSMEEGVRKGGDFDVLTNRLRNISGEITTAREKITAAAEADARTLARAEQAAARVADKATDRVTTNAKRRTGALATFAAQFDKIGASFGKAFGKGSRNDFLNLTGSLVGGIAKLPGLVARITEAVGKGLGSVFGFLQKLGVAAEQTGEMLTEGSSEAVKSFQATGKGAAEAGEAIAATGPAGLIAALVAVTAALFALPVVVGTVVSAFSLLIGAATALASALTFAVVGALAPLVGLMLPLAAAVGVVALAFAGLNKAAKKTLTESVAPLKNGLDDLRKTAQKPILDAFQKNAKGLKTAIGNISPLIKAVAEGVAGIFTSFVQGMNSPGFTNFISAISLTLPDQVRSLGQILKNAFGGLGGLFLALQPVTDKFLDALENITGKFSEWTQSTMGQATLKTFFDSAWESANKVWDIIKQLGADLGKLIGAGKDTGDSFLDSILSTLEDIGDWLDAHPQALADWFAQSKQAVKSIGPLIDSIKDLVDELDSPQNRRNVQILFKAIDAAVTYTSGLFKAIKIAWEIFVTSLRVTPFGVFFAFITGGFKGVATSVLKAIDSILKGIQSLATAGSKLPGPMGDAFRKVASAIGGARSSVQGLIDDLNRVPTTKKVIIDTSTKGYKTTVAQLADINYKANKIPKEVTIGVNAKLSANADKLLNDNGRGQLAAGALVTSARRVTVGEAGPEAVVPLARPLAQVDPSVRALSAIAQGKAPAMASGGVTPGKVVNVGGLTVITPTEDPFAVAQETINKLVGAAYI